MCASDIHTFELTGVGVDRPVQRSSMWRTNSSYYRRACDIGSGIDRAGVGFFTEDVLSSVHRWFAGGSCRYQLFGDQIFLFGPRVRCIFFACVINDRWFIVGAVGGRSVGDVVGFILLVGVCSFSLWVLDDTVI